MRSLIGNPATSVRHAPGVQWCSPPEPPKTSASRWPSAMAETFTSRVRTRFAPVAGTYSKTAFTALSSQRSRCRSTSHIGPSPQRLASLATSSSTPGLRLLLLVGERDARRQREDDHDDLERVEFVVQDRDRQDDGERRVESRHRRDDGGLAV